MRTHKSPSADLSQWNRRFRLSTITLPPKLKHLSSPHIASPGMRQAAPRLLPIETVSVRSMHADLQAKMSFCETNPIPNASYGPPTLTAMVANDGGRDPIG